MPVTSSDGVKGNMIRITVPAVQPPSPSPHTTGSILGVVEEKRDDACEQFW